MLKIIPNQAELFSKYEQHSQSVVFKNGNYDDFVNKKIQKQEKITTCPTDAIDYKGEEIIHEKCVECMLCAFRFPDSIKFVHNENSFHKFQTFASHDKAALVRWVSLILQHTANIPVGLDIKVNSGYREKRIPLLSIINEVPVIWKAEYAFKNIKKGVLYLNDICSAIEKMGFVKPLKILLINGTKKDFIQDEKIQQFYELLKSKYTFTLISTEFLWCASRSFLTKKLNWNKILFSCDIRV